MWPQLSEGEVMLWVKSPVFAMYGSQKEKKQRLKRFNVHECTNISEFVLHRLQTELRASKVSELDVFFCTFLSTEGLMGENYSPPCCFRTFHGGCSIRSSRKWLQKNYRQGEKQQPDHFRPTKTWKKWNPYEIPLKECLKCGSICLQLLYVNQKKNTNTKHHFSFKRTK